MSTKGRASDRPTLSPPFDVADYARKSDAKVRTARPSDKPTEPPAEPAAVEVLSTECIPRLVMSGDDLAWLELEKKTRSVLDAVDGRATVDAIAAACGLSEADVMTILGDLCMDGVITFD